MEASRCDETEADDEVSSPACLVLPVNPLPSSSDKPRILSKVNKRKAGKQKTHHDKKYARKVLCDYGDCSVDLKPIILDSTEEPIVSEMSEASTSLAAQDGASSSEGADPEDVLDPVTQSWFTSRDSKDSLTKEGHKWKQGMWSKEEVDILERNIEEYLKIHQLGDAVSVIFRMTKEERKDFYRFIAKGLNRPLFAVYRRVIRMYDSKNHVGKYTAEEIQKLKELRVKYGNEWCAIGAEMGRSSASVKDKVRLLKDRCHQGKWTISEEQLLADAVYTLSDTSRGESVTTGISWSLVAAKVPTRTEKQCRAKWLNYLNWKYAGGTEWTKEDDNKLLDRLAESNAKNDNQVDWEGLAKDWRSVRSPQWLRSKWWMLKRHIMGHDEMSLRTLVDHLRSNPGGSKQMKPFRGCKRLPAGVNMSVPMASLSVPLGSSEQVDVYQYEVLDASMGLAPTSAYVLHSATGPGETTASADGYIVAAMQGEQLQSNENVTVHLNHLNRTLLPSGQILISTLAKNPGMSTNPVSEASSARCYGRITTKREPGTSLEGDGEDSTDGLEQISVKVRLAQQSAMDDQSGPSEDSTLSQSQLMGSSHEGQLTGDIGQSEQSEDNPLGQSEMLRDPDNQLAGDISQSDQSEEHSLSNQSQLIGTDAVLAQQDMVPEVSEESETQLVIVNTAPSTGLMQPVGPVDDSSQLAGGVFSLSGQILQAQSDGSDLLESPTSVDAMTRDKMSSPSSSELS